MTESNAYRGLAWVAAMALFMQSLDATILILPYRRYPPIYINPPLKCKWRLLLIL